MTLTLLVDIMGVGRFFSAVAELTGDAGSPQLPLVEGGGGGATVGITDDALL